MLGAGHSPIRRVGPSPAAVDRYGHAGSQTSNSKDEEHTSESEDDEQTTSDSQKALRPPSEREDPGPALLPNRPVLRWLRMAPNARIRLSPACTNPLYVAPERKQACQELATYLATTSQRSIAERLEPRPALSTLSHAPAQATRKSASPLPGYPPSDSPDAPSPQSDIDVTG